MDYLKDPGVWALGLEYGVESSSGSTEADRICDLGQVTYPL